MLLMSIIIYCHLMVSFRKLKDRACCNLYENTVMSACQVILEFHPSDRFRIIDEFLRYEKIKRQNRFCVILYHYISNLLNQCKVQVLCEQSLNQIFCAYPNYELIFYGLKL